MAPCFKSKRPVEGTESCGGGAGPDLDEARFKSKRPVEGTERRHLWGVGGWPDRFKSKRPVEGTERLIENAPAFVSHGASRANDPLRVLKVFLRALLRALLQLQEQTTR